MAKSISLEQLIADISASDLDSKEVLIASCYKHSRSFPGQKFYVNICEDASIEQAIWLKNHAYFPTFWADGDRDTALMTAISMGSLKAANVMIQSGVDIHATDIDGDNALNYASQNLYIMYANEKNNSTLICMTLLLEAGINMNSRGSRGMTPLMQAVCFGSDKLNRSLLLLTYGADLNIPDGKGFRPVDSLPLDFLWQNCIQLKYLLKVFS